MSDSLLTRFMDRLGGNRPVPHEGAQENPQAEDASTRPVPNGERQRPPADRQASEKAPRPAAPQKQKQEPVKEELSPAVIAHRAKQAENQPQEQKRTRGPMAAAQSKSPQTKNTPPEGTALAPNESEAAAVVETAPAEEEAPIVFEGILLTAIGGAIKIPQESRNLCALFDTGLWIVSASHRNSPLVTSVAATARRMGYSVGAPRLVTPDVIKSAYNYFERQVSSMRLDENSVRRQIVRTLAAGAESGANDIHIEASAGRTKIEFRIDGTLRMWETWTQKEGEQFLSSVYSHSSGQSGATANWLEPQAAMLTQGGGPDTIALPEGILAVRCQWVPLADGGRYLNMRLQYDSSRIFGENFVQSDVDTLGFNQEQTELVRFLRRVPGGMRILSGPVNQGKTTTLRVMLNRHMQETNMEQKCYMIEDPPEGGVVGASQIGVSATVKDEQRERSFMEIMRCILRLDPNIVMLGETRDLQTTKFIFRLALTGRQVYTTLHVYSAIAIPQRLRDLGAEPYLVYDHHLLIGLVCQRLLRGLCPHCRIPARNKMNDPAHESILRRVRAGLAIMQSSRRLPKEDADEFDYLQEPDMRGVYFVNPEGCRHCFQGRMGRTIVAEVIATDARLMSLLSENKLDEATRYWLSPFGLNGITMLWHGLEKIRDGGVSPFDAELEVGPSANDRDVRRVEERLGRKDKWLI